VSDRILASWEPKWVFVKHKLAFGDDGHGSVVACTCGWAYLGGRERCQEIGDKHLMLGAEFCASPKRWKAGADKGYYAKLDEALNRTGLVGAVVGSIGVPIAPDDNLEDAACRDHLS
jgi:hypothetical protein